MQWASTWTTSGWHTHTKKERDGDRAEILRGDHGHRGNHVRRERPEGEWQSRSVRGGGQGWDCKAKERCRHGFAFNSHWASKYHTNTHAQWIHMASFSLKWDSTHCVAKRGSFSPKVRITLHLCGILPQGEKKQKKMMSQHSPPCWHTGYKQHRMSLNEPWWSVRAHQHRTMRARGRGRRKWGYGEGVAGIQLTGTSFQYHLEGDYPVCRDKRGEGGTDEEQEQKDQQVRGNRQRIGSATGLNWAKESRVRTTPKCH